MELIVIGTGYKEAPVDVREKFSFTPEEQSLFLTRLLQKAEISEGIILSTCNRLEFYLVCTDDIDKDDILKEITFFKGVKVDSNIFYIHKNLDGVRHLFRVASGLESQMVGENQIQGQVKDAYTQALKLGSNGPYLNKLFHQAFGVGKSVRTKTNLGAGAVSISSAAVELAGHIYEGLFDKSVLLIGAGETGELVAKHLLGRGIASLKIANRTEAKAKELAQRYSADAVPFSSIAKEFVESDIVISATSSNGYILTEKDLSSLSFGKAQGKFRQGSKKIMAIDIAVPRDIDPKVGEIDNVFLYDMDDLKVVVEKNIELRQSEIVHAEKLVNSAMANFEKWLREQKVVPTIKVLQQKFEDVRRQEIEKNKHCSTCSKRGEVDAITKKILSKILMTPITRLVENTNCTQEELDYLRTMFAGKLDEK